MMLAPLRIALICSLTLAPPYTATTLTPLRKRANSVRSRAICRHSSRVGHRINACTASTSGSTPSTTGRPKPAVLPVPVRARATRSRSESRMAGMVCACTGVGVVKPNSATARLTSSRSDVSLKLSISPVLYGRNGLLHSHIPVPYVSPSAHPCVLRSRKSTQNSWAILGFIRARPSRFWRD